MHHVAKYGHERYGKVAEGIYKDLETRTEGTPSWT
ncbi:lipase-like domain-containing protein [Staphylococcus aureus]